MHPLIGLLLLGRALAADGGCLNALFPTTRAAVEHPEPAYHFAADAYADIGAAIVRSPGTVTPFVVGCTLRDAPIWGFTVRDPATPVAHRLLLIANIHALEWIPTEDAVAFLLDYASRPIPGVEVVIVPIVNVDGREKVEADLRAGRHIYRRGNDAHIDLNRDWLVNRESDAIWRHLLPGRYTVSPSGLSQPETRAIDALIRTHTTPPDVPFEGFVSLHSFGGFIYYPWAGRWERAPDWPRLHAIGEAMEAAMGPHAYRPRQLSRWGFFFRGLGMEVDHVYGEFGIPSFLVETTRSGITRPADLRDYFRWYNPRKPERHVRTGVSMLRAWVTATLETGDPLAPPSSAPTTAPPPSQRGQ